MTCKLLGVWSGTGLGGFGLFVVLTACTEVRLNGGEPLAPRPELLPSPPAITAVVSCGSDWTSGSWFTSVRLPRW